MRTCPYCGKPAMSAGEKATLGPFKSVNCKSCGKRISVSWMSLLALAAFFAGGVAGLYLGMPTGILALLVGAVLMFVIHEYAVPLVPRP